MEPVKKVASLATFMGWSEAKSPTDLLEASESRVTTYKIVNDRVTVYWPDSRSEAWAPFTRSDHALMIAEHAAAKNWTFLLRITVKRSTCEIADRTGVIGYASARGVAAAISLATLDAIEDEVTHRELEWAVAQ